MVLKIVACIILAIWLFLVIEIGWDNGSSRIRNIVYGILIFCILGVVYYVPAWILFLR